MSGSTLGSHNIFFRVIHQKSLMCGGRFGSCIFVPACSAEYRWIGSLDELHLQYSPPLSFPRPANRGESVRRTALMRAFLNS